MARRADGAHDPERELFVRVDPSRSDLIGSLNERTRETNKPLLRPFHPIDHAKGPLRDFGFDVAHDAKAGEQRFLGCLGRGFDAHSEDSLIVEGALRFDFISH